MTPPAPHTDTREHILSTAGPLVLGKGFYCAGFDRAAERGRGAQGFVFTIIFARKEQFGQPAGALLRQLRRPAGQPFCRRPGACATGC